MKHGGKLLALLSLAALAAGAYLGMQSRSPTVTAATLAQIHLPDVDKQMRSGDEWRGNIVIVNHWASWCAPCRDEIPLLIDAQERFGDLGLQVVGIAHEPPDAARVFGDEIGINYPSLIAVNDGIALMRQQGNSAGGLPFTAFFDREGELASVHLGQIFAEDLEEVLGGML